MCGGNHDNIEYSGMKYDKDALEKISQDLEVDLEQEDEVVLSDEDKLHIRENILSVIEKYFLYMGASTHEETLETLAETREALSAIYSATSRARHALAFATKPENKELADILNSFFIQVRAQAEAVFEKLN